MPTPIIKSCKQVPQLGLLMMSFYLVLLSVLGFQLRLFDIEKKLISDDESRYNTLASGITLGEERTKMGRAGVLGPKDLIELHSQFNPSLPQVISNVLRTDPTHSPFYFALAHLLRRTCDLGIFSERYLSAFLSSLLIPSIFWLVFLLSKSPFPSIAAATIAAISPVCVECAQEGREYGFMMVLAVLSSCLFLRALSKSTPVAWSLYGLMSSFSIYNHFFSSVVLFGHFLYLVSSRSSKKHISRFFWAVGIVLITYGPWMRAMIPHYQFQRELVEISENFSLNSALALLRNPALTFVDFDPNNSHFGTFRYYLPSLLMITWLGILGAFGLYGTKKDASKFVWTQILSSYLVMMGCFFVGIGEVVMRVRYFLPLNCSVIVMSVLSCETLIDRLRYAPKKRIVGCIAACLMVGLSFFSLAQYYQRTTSWVLFGGLGHDRLLDIISRDSGSYIVADAPCNIVGIVSKLSESHKIIVIKQLQNFLQLEPLSVPVYLISPFKPLLSR